MARRTTSALVAQVLGDDYDGSASLIPRIDTANALVDDIVTEASNLEITVSASRLEIIERWLAAHFYAVCDKPLQSKSTERASGVFAGHTAMGLKYTQYGQQAIILDPTGYLSSIGEERKVARGFWAGTTDTNASTYDERNR